MKKLALFLCLSLLSSVAAAQNATTGNVNLFLGGKTLSEADWGIWNEQGEFGVLIDVQTAGMPVSFAIDLLGSAEERYGLLVSTSELDFGLRMIFDVDGTTLHPYVGGGLGFMGGRIEDTWFGGEDEDTSMGLWLNGGVYVTLGEHFNLGLDLRYSSAEVTLLNTPVEIGGNHAGLLLGYHW